MKPSVLICASALLLCRLAAQEIPNGDFSKGTEGWEVSAKGAAKASQEVVQDADEGKPALKITVSEAPQSSWWMVNVRSAPSIKLEAGTTYTVSFKARSEAGARAVAVKISADRKSVAQGQKFKINEEWQEFLYSFLPDAETDSACLVFDDLAVNQAVFYFSDIRISKE